MDVFISSKLQPVDPGAQGRRAAVPAWRRASGARRSKAQCAHPHVSQRYAGSELAGSASTLRARRNTGLWCGGASMVRAQRSQLPSCPSWNDGGVHVFRGATRSWPESSDIESKFKANAREGVAVQTKGRRCLADIAVVVPERGRDKGLLELAYGFPVEDAAAVHLCYQQIQALLHGKPRLLRVHRFRAKSKSNSAALTAHQAVECGKIKGNLG